MEAADITWEIGAGYIRHGKATVQNVSSSGMGLLVPSPFTVGTKLRITIGLKTHAAIVRRCIRQGAGFLLGVQFER